MSRSRRLSWLVVVFCISCTAPTVADMVFPGRDWEEATPESQGVNPTKLEEAVKFLEKHSGPDGVKEAVIIRDGRMIWKGPEIDKRHGVWSVTKSFTSTVLGLLVDDGKCTLDTPARRHVPALASTFPGVTSVDFFSNALPRTLYSLHYQVALT